MPSSHEEILSHYRADLLQAKREHQERLEKAAPALYEALRVALDAFDYARSGREYPEPHKIAEARAALALVDREEA